MFARFRYHAVRGPVLGRSVSPRTPVAVHVARQHVRGLRHAGRERTVVVSRLSHDRGRAGRGGRGQLRFAVPVAGTADVAAVQGPGGRGRGRGKVVRHRTAGAGRGGRGRRRQQYGVFAVVRLVRVRAPDRVEAHADHAGVLRVPAGLRLLRAAPVLGGGAPRHHRVAGAHRHRLPVHGPGGRRPGVLGGARRPAAHADGRVQRRHGRVRGRGHRLPGAVRGRGRPAVHRHRGRGVRFLRFLLADRRHAVALDTQQRGVPHGRQRYAQPYTTYPPGASATFGRVSVSIIMSEIV